MAWDHVFHIRHFYKDGVTEFHPGDKLHISEESKKELDAAFLRAAERLERSRARKEEAK